MSIRYNKAVELIEKLIEAKMATMAISMDSEAGKEERVKALADVKAELARELYRADPPARAS